MSTLSQFMTSAGAIVVIAPASLVAILGLSTLLGQKLAERTIDRACKWSIAIGLLATIVVLFSMLATGERHVVVHFGDWVEFQKRPNSSAENYRFSVKFAFDRLSVPFVMLSYILCGTIVAFAGKYMHREPGFNRFFVLYAVFLLGMVVAALASTIETLFAGWELVGLSSTLLIAFFQERPAPCRNGLRVWVIYRISDAALLLAAVVLHHMSGGGDFDTHLGSESWPERHFDAPSNEALLVGVLILFAAAGKSALIPFSGWLPRAMEGPTPSSAVFYGALSVHLGAYLLLRLSPLIAASLTLAILVVTLGLSTALLGYLIGTVQTDIKSALSFASLSQVGIIVAEVGLAYRVPFLLYVALVHLIGHAFLRTLQFVRAPSFLQDYHTLENAIGERLPRPPGLLAWAPISVGVWLYRFALERGYLDAILSEYIAEPFLGVFRIFNNCEKRWTDLLNGKRANVTAESNHPSRL